MAVLVPSTAIFFLGRLIRLPTAQGTESRRPDMNRAVGPWRAILVPISYGGAIGYYKGTPLALRNMARNLGNWFNCGESNSYGGAIGYYKGTPLALVASEIASVWASCSCAECRAIVAEHNLSSIAKTNPKRPEPNPAPKAQTIVAYGNAIGQRRDSFLPPLP